MTESRSYPGDQSQSIRSGTVFITSRSERTFVENEKEHQLQYDQRKDRFIAVVAGAILHLGIGKIEVDQFIDRARRVIVSDPLVEVDTVME